LTFIREISAICEKSSFAEAAKCSDGSQSREEIVFFIVCVTWPAGMKESIKENQDYLIPIESEYGRLAKTIVGALYCNARILNGMNASD
jgi:hypothetical protein